MTAATQTRPLSVPELRAAARALLAGRFRPDAPASVEGRWTPAPGERAVVVLGCGGGAGTTTVAVALASAAGVARVVECCSGVQSGLVAASFTELGEADDGWLRGQRDQLMLERRALPLDDFAALPLPLPATDSGTVTVVDAGGDLDQARRSGWLADLIGDGPLVVVTRASMPGTRRLESLLARLESTQIAGVAIIGPQRRRWPSGLVFSLGRLTRALDEGGRLVAVPEDPGLALHGLDSSVLPTKTLAAGAALAELLTPPLTQ